MIVECTMPSAPALTATPNCFVLNRLAASEFASRVMQLAKRRRMASPTGMGWTPHFKFFQRSFCWTTKYRKKEFGKLTPAG